MQNKKRGGSAGQRRGSPRGAPQHGQLVKVNALLELPPGRLDRRKGGVRLRGCGGMHALRKRAPAANTLPGWKRGRWR